MTMPASERELWACADALLDRLLDLAEADRAATLAAMSLPPELLDRVQRLLRAHASSGALEQPLPWVADGESSQEHAADGMAGRIVGGWELQRELGRGGMSVVYLACRGEGAHRQRAALKLLTLGALAGDGLRRFRHEQAILTRLNHPHIAHLHEAGETADGTPYLVIELVEGERIDQWCDARGLSVRERVALVLDVCAALAYAHRNLVVHADLKPSNVLVDGEGHVRVVDFGIGRLLDEELIDATQSRARALTPQYAAPEQLAGARATTAADVFGLGALLYRLLCGRPPRPAAHGRAITAPSRVPAEGDQSQQRRHARSLSGDLDTVLMKALAEEPERRYSSVEALAHDLRAWCERRPVAARPPSVRYWLGRFVARHRAAVATAALVLALFAAGAVQVVVQRNHAQEQARRAVIVRDFLSGVFLSAEASSGKVPDALDLLGQGSARARSELLQRDPRAAADVLLITGGARIALNDFDRAQHDLALALRTLQAIDPPPAYELSLVHLEFGRLHRVRGPLDVSIAHFRQALDWARRAQAPVGDRLSAELLLAAALSKTDQRDDAQQRLRQLATEIPAAGLANTQLHMDALNALSASLAKSARADDRAERLELHAQRLEVARRLYGENDGTYAFHLADSVPSYRNAGQLDRAEALARQALAITDRIYDKPHMYAAVAACNLAAVLQQRGDLHGALSWYDRNIAIDEALDRNDVHAESCRYNRAYSRAGTGDFEGARRDLYADRVMLGKLDNGAGYWLRNCGMEASVLVRQAQPTAATALLDTCAATHASDPAVVSAEFLLARAELAHLHGDAASASALLADLRERQPPSAVSRSWMRAWMLSLLHASKIGDAAMLGRLRDDLRDYSGNPVQGHCMAAATLATEACLALP